MAGGLGETTALDVLPDGRVLVSEQTGTLAFVPATGGAATTALTITVDSDGERGLLGVAHDPKFASNHFIYVYHTVPANGAAAPFNEVTRYTLNGNVAEPASAVNILKLNDLGAAFHNGGSMHFGPDGKLYIGVGENTQPANFAQTLSNLLGKILRIDVSKIVAGDPVNDVCEAGAGGQSVRREGEEAGSTRRFTRLGFRNPFTFAVNSNGTIYVNDVGLATWEEIDLLKAGGNYGWILSEGFNGNAPSGLGPGHYVDPLLAYNHTGGPAGGGSAIIGGVLYTPPAGAAHPFPTSFNGKYFYADLGFDWMRVFDSGEAGEQGEAGYVGGICDIDREQPGGVCDGAGWGDLLCGAWRRRRVAEDFVYGYAAGGHAAAACGVYDGRSECELHGKRDGDGKADVPVAAERQRRTVCGDCRRDVEHADVEGAEAVGQRGEVPAGGSERRRRDREQRGVSDGGSAGGAGAFWKDDGVSVHGGY